MWPLNIWHWSVTDCGQFTSNQQNHMSYRELTSKEEVVTGSFFKEKCLYYEDRGYHCVFSTRKKDKLRENLKQFQEQVNSHGIIVHKWINDKSFWIILGSGLTIKISLDTVIIDEIKIYKSLSTKLPSHNVSTGVITDQCVFLTFTDRVRCCYFSPNLLSDTAGLLLKQDQSSNSEIWGFDLPTKCYSDMKRNIAVNSSVSLVTLWWRSSLHQPGLRPWMPLNHDKDVANILIYAYRGLSVTGMIPVTHYETEFDLIDLRFSKYNETKLLTIQKHSHTSHDLTFCNYAITQNTVMAVEMFEVKIQAPVACITHSTCEDKVILGLTNSHIAIYDRLSNSLREIQLDILPSCVSCHRDDGLITVVSRNGELQLLDVGLNVLSDGVHRLLQGYIVECGGQPLLCWMPDNHRHTHTLFVMFHSISPILVEMHTGVFHNGRLGVLEIFQHHMTATRITEAIRILRTLNWNIDPDKCHFCFSNLLNYLLRKPLNSSTEDEIEQVMESVLQPDYSINTDIRMRFIPHVINSYSHIYFHTLLRNRRLEKAYMLAIDISSSDLFMDIYHMARSLGEQALAEQALTKAQTVCKESHDDSLLDDREEMTQFSDDNNTTDHSFTESHYAELLETTSDQYKTILWDTVPSTPHPQ